MTPVVPPPPVLQISSISSSDHSSQRSHATNISETSDPDAWFIRQRTPFQQSIAISAARCRHPGAGTPAPPRGCPALRALRWVIQLTGRRAQAEVLQGPWHPDTAMGVLERQ